MGYNTAEYEWKRITVTVLGEKLTGLRAFEFNDDVEDEHLYGSGPVPIDVQEGNEAPSGSLTMLKYEYDKLNLAAKDAGYKALNRVPSGLIVITVEFKKYEHPISSITVTGVKFGSVKQGMSQGDKFMEIELPFLALSID